MKKTTMLDGLKFWAMVLGLVLLSPVLVPLYLFMAAQIGDDGDCQEPEFKALSEREKQRA
ncbi:MAG: hypothetical protein IKW38_05540 [Kiritimatiellae bacterium]|nr:hypothetical protein [Kiritimatiellia bacterium]